MRARALTLATLVSRGLLGRSRYRRRAARFGEMLPAREGGGTRETGLVLFSRPLFVPKKGLMLGRFRHRQKMSQVLVVRKLSKNFFMAIATLRTRVFAL